MKTKILITLFLIPALTFAQIKGKKSKEPFKTADGVEYKVGDKITLADPSNDGKYAFVYKFKSSLSFGNIVKTVKNVNEVSRLNVSSTRGIKNAINTAKNVAGNDLLKNSVASLQSKVVSEKYVSDNALEAKMSGKAYTIKSFKVYKDEESGKQVVHAITKGKGGKVAILLEAAKEKGEI